MGLLNRITKGITRGIGNAVGKATQRAVEKKATEVLTPKINQAADAISSNAKSSATVNTNNLESALGNLAGAMNGYVNEAAQNLKICPKCNAGNSADKKFCSKCGEALPEKTLGSLATCPNCGKKNSVTERFCSDCGTKLPITLEEEEKQKKSDEAVMQEWENSLLAYPKWQLGGRELSIDCYDQTYYVFTAKFDTNQQAVNAVESYRNYIKQNGFREAGQYPNKEHLYKKENGVCYHVDTEHCFEGDPDRLTIGFDNNEPTGGFDYVKPEQKKKGLFGLF